MGGVVIYYEYEKGEKFKNYHPKVDAELGTFKIRRYHFDYESFVHPLHIVRFDPNRSYEVPIEALMTNRPLSSSGNGNGSAQSMPTSTLSQSQLRSSTIPSSFKVLDKPLQQEHLNLTPHGILITND
ncbi:hypothetical protein PIB30_062548 [Stylosanthes scabra]|uniref:Uncharacterized protein n=1 Tax=Stylosanthes scabra TaxID=79078 RepID=A0ABU6UK78_9FABA|nr:hypothetical protein [Stylosanthes scabra]